MFLFGMMVDDEEFCYVAGSFVAFWYHRSFSFIEMLSFCTMQDGDLVVAVVPRHQFYMI
jgi:hypothetical protein